MFYITRMDDKASGGVYVQDGAFYPDRPEVSKPMALEDLPDWVPEELQKMDPSTVDLMHLSSEVRREMGLPPAPPKPEELKEPVAERPPEPEPEPKEDDWDGNFDEAADEADKEKKEKEGATKPRTQHKPNPPRGKGKL